MTRAARTDRLLKAAAADLLQDALRGGEVRLPTYSYHRIPPRDVISDAGTERGPTGAAGTNPVNHSAPAPFGSHWSTPGAPRWQAAVDCLPTILGEIFPRFALAFGATLAALAIIDAIIRGCRP